MATNLDWSGNAAPVSSKKHVAEPPSKIATLSSGICADDEAWKPGRKVADKTANSSSTSIIGGPVPQNSPSVVEPSHWKTEARAASERTKTTTDMLTEGGRSIYVRGKKSTIPPYELARPFDESVGARLREENPYTLVASSGRHKAETQENGHPNTYSAKSSDSFVGYRSGAGSRSFLAGLGTDVAAVMNKE